MRPNKVMHFIEMCFFALKLEVMVRITKKVFLNFQILYALVIHNEHGQLNFSNKLERLKFINGNIKNIF